MDVVERMAYAGMGVVTEKGTALIERIDELAEKGRSSELVKPEQIDRLAANWAKRWEDVVNLYSRLFGNTGTFGSKRSKDKEETLAGLSKKLDEIELKIGSIAQF